jgi:site-specific DNA-methyltransferase (adenine-specific)
MTFTIIRGDCLDVLDALEPETVQLIVTSPPYADQRRHQYGAIDPDEYVDWFLPRAAKFKRVLTPTGTFILNIKEKVVDGQRHLYVFDLVSALVRQQGWLFTEEYMWHKKNSSPGKWPNRFRDGWEHLFQFNAQRAFDMHQREVRVPIGNWAKGRLTHLSEKDKTRDPSGTGSGFAKNVSNWVGRGEVYPDNVLHLSSEVGNKRHSAAFPVALPTFFVKLFSRPDELVLDPFCGSGTTGEAAVSLGRRFLGIDTKAEFVDEAKTRVGSVEARL